MLKFKGTKKKIMKIVFFGTPEFAVPTLEALKIANNIEVTAVITQPDKKVGRKQILSPPAVKSCAQKLNIEVKQPTNKEELKEMVKNFEVDFFIVIAYGMILDKEILSIPKYGAINIHASLLPKYRGASPIQQSLLNGDEETGISIMKMNEKMDQGPVYFMKKLEIKDDSLEILTKKLALLGSLHLVPILEDIESGMLNPIPQKEENATYCKKITKEDGKINWGTQSADQIINMIRAFTPWPSVYTTFNNKNLKIIKAKKSQTTGTKEIGKLYSENKELKVNTINGTLEILEVQPEGKSAIKATDFINGNKSML